MATRALLLLIGFLLSAPHEAQDQPPGEQCFGYVKGDIYLHCAESFATDTPLSSGQDIDTWAISPNGESLAVVHRSNRRVIEVTDLRTGAVKALAFGNIIGVTRTCGTLVVFEDLQQQIPRRKFIDLSNKEDLPFAPAWDMRCTDDRRITIQQDAISVGRGSLRMVSPEPGNKLPAVTVFDLSPRGRFLGIVKENQACIVDLQQRLRDEKCIGNIWDSGRISIGDDGTALLTIDTLEDCSKPPVPTPCQGILMANVDGSRKLLVMGGRDPQLIDSTAAARIRTWRESWNTVTAAGTLKPVAK